jgi:hypothetical protein
MTFVHTITIGGRLAGIFYSYEIARKSVMLTYSACPERLVPHKSTPNVEETWIDAETKEYIRLSSEQVLYGINHL